MKKTLYYLDALKEAEGLTSDYALAKYLSINRAVISQYRSGKMVIDDYVCLMIAKRLELDPLEVISLANAEREKDETKKAVWENLYQTVARPVAAVTTVPKSQAATKKAPVLKTEAPSSWRKGGDSNPR